MESFVKSVPSKSFNTHSLLHLLSFTLFGLVVIGISSNLPFYGAFYCGIKDVSLRRFTTSKCALEYDDKYHFTIPMDAIFVLHFGIVLFFSLIYAYLVKGRVEKFDSPSVTATSNCSNDVEDQTIAFLPRTGQNSLEIRKSCGRFSTFTIYIVSLLVCRVIPLTVSAYVFYSANFPRNFPCRLVPLEKSVTFPFNDTLNSHPNFTIVIDCINPIGKKSQALVETVAIADTIFVILTFFEIAYIAWLTFDDKDFMTDPEFCTVYLLRKRKRIRKFINKFRESLNIDFKLKDDFGHDKIASRNLRNIYVNVVIQQGRQHINAYPREYERHEMYQSHLETTKPIAAFTCPTDVFKPNKHSIMYPRTILVIGRPGVGKTMLTRELLHQWKETEDEYWNKKIVILLRFRDFRNKTVTLREMLRNGDGLSSLTSNEFETLFNAILTNPTKTVLIFDGLDELDVDERTETLICVNDKMPVFSILKMLVCGAWLRGVTVLTTSRPTTEPLIQNLVVEFDRIVEILGFSGKQIERYVFKFCDHYDTGKLIWSQIKESQELLSFCYLPVNSYIICLTLKERIQNREERKEHCNNLHEDIPKSITELYHKALKVLLCRHHPKLKFDLEWQRDYFSRSFPEVVNDDLVKLKKLAKVKIDEGKCLFILKDENTKLENCGLLHKLADKPVICFVHLTLQEFLAALYVVDDMDIVEQFLATYVDNPKWHLVIQFVAGLVGDKIREAKKAESDDMYAYRMQGIIDGILKRYIREERLEVQVWLTAKHHDDTVSLPHKRDKLVGSAYVALFPLLDGNKNFSQISGLYSLYRSSAVDLCGAGLHVQLVLQKPPNSNQASLGGEIDEDIASTEHSESAIQEKDSLTIVSSDEENCDKDVGRNTPEAMSLQKDDNNVITAHVVIEQALHLPLVKIDKNESVKPNVYVTYQPKADVNVIKTKIFPLSSSPVWAHQKIVKFDKTTISKQVLTFKVWHSQGDADKSGKSISVEDLLLGVASLDLSPLASGLRQVMGWYNIVNFSGQCQGQIKVGVVPLLSVSPDRFEFPHLSEDAASKHHMLGEQTMDWLSKQSRGITSDSKDYPVCKSSLKEPDCSKSFLLRQLRQNLSDLDVIKDKLSRRLKANNECVMSSCSEKSDKRHPNDKELETNLECLTTYPRINDANLLQSSRTVFSIQDKLSDEFSDHLHDDEDEESPVAHTSAGSRDSNQVTNDENKVQDSLHLNDFHGYGVNGIEHNQDSNSFTELNDVNDRTDIDPNYRDEDDDDDNNDNCVSQTGHLENVHDSDYDHISDHSNVDGHLGGSESNHSTAVLKNVNHDILHHNKDFLRNDNHDTTEDNSFGPSDLNFSQKNMEHSNADNQENPGDKLLDSFFDCVTLKQRSEPNSDFRLSADDALNDTVEPESVVSRLNLSKLRKGLYESKKEDKQTTNLPEHRADLLCTDINDEDNEGSLIIQPCGDQKDSSSEPSANGVAVESKESEQEQFAYKRFEERSNYGTSLKRTSIPNFFMPPNDLEQSMRSLRLAATFRKQPRKDNENIPKEQMQGVTDQEIFRSHEKVETKSYLKWKKVQEIRTTGEIPLSSGETSRLAKIFSSNYSTKTSKM